MRGKLWFSAAAAALMAFGLAPAASAQTADQPGDASTTATLTGNTDGEISPAGDTDWYRLQVETGRRYNLALAGIPNEAGEALDPMLAVYDAQGNQLAFNDDANGSLNSALRYAPQSSGVVYVEARAFSSEATGAYRLGVSSEEVPPDDAGGDASTRARAAAGRTTNGNIEYEGDIDWYRFAARTGNRYHITLDGARRRRPWRSDPPRHRSRRQRARRQRRQRGLAELGARFRSSRQWRRLHRSARLR